jgi:hypothetical protein
MLHFCFSWWANHAESVGHVVLTSSIRSESAAPPPSSALTEGVHLADLVTARTTGAQAFLAPGFSPPRWTLRSWAAIMPAYQNAGRASR